MNSNKLERGKIKFFNKEKGYGFITMDNGETDMFVHKNDCNDRTPKQDDRVEFWIGQGKKGLIAKDVNII